VKNEKENENDIKIISNYKKVFSALPTPTEPAMRYKSHKMKKLHEQAV